jgi:hypothetical protein
VIDALIAELFNDPLGRGYAGMTAEQAAASLNAVNRPRFRSAIPAAEIFAAVDLTEYKALTAQERDAFALVIAMGTVNANDANTRGILSAIFPGGGATRPRLIAVAQEQVSRAAELGLGDVMPGHIEEARRIHG